MKTMKKGDEIIRVVEPDVDNKIKSGYAFCKKSEWKKIHGKGSKPAERSEKSEKDQEQRTKGHKGDRNISKYREKQANN